MNDLKDNPLSISWHDSHWIPHLNAGNVLEYFSERSNPFYDRTCNNEIIKMQRSNPEQIKHMEGLEYELLHVQEPILYVIRKQWRQSVTTANPLCDYYILAGYVYQSPDLNSVLNSRLLTAVYHLISGFEETHSYMRYHPTRGYSWDFGKDSQNDKDKDVPEKEKERVKERAKDDMGSSFQRRRVDMILTDLIKKFPPKIPQQPSVDTSTKTEPPPDTKQPVPDVKTDPKPDLKREADRSLDSGPVLKKQRT